MLVNAGKVKVYGSESTNVGKVYGSESTNVGKVYGSELVNAGKAKVYGFESALSKAKVYGEN